MFWMGLGGWWIGILITSKIFSNRFNTMQCNFTDLISAMSKIEMSRFEN